MLPNRPQQKKTRNSSVKTSNFVIPPGSEFFDPETIREKEEKAIVGGGWPPKTPVVEGTSPGKLR